jgi:hypothetical protein
MAKAFQQKLGDDAEEAAKVLYQHGIPRDFAKQALALAERQGRFTLFSLVDALTRVAGKTRATGRNWTRRLARSWRWRRRSTGCAGRMF